jgi:hypothetical protein
MPQALFEIKADLTNIVGDESNPRLLGMLREGMLVKLAGYLVYLSSGLSDTVYESLDYYEATDGQPVYIIDTLVPTDINFITLQSSHCNEEIVVDSRQSDALLDHLAKIGICFLGDDGNVYEVVQYL